MIRIFRKFDACKHDLWNGDVLLVPRDGLVSIAGRGSFAHAAMLVWWRGQPMVCEFREWHGARAVTLVSQVASQPIDVFRVEPRYHDAAERAADIMVRKLGRHYAWHHIAAAALLHLPFVRIFARPDTDADPLEESRLPEFCSEAIANAWHVASGVDPVPQLRHRYTEPNDLARTTFFRYRFSIKPSSQVQQ